MTTRIFSSVIFAILAFCVTFSVSAPAGYTLVWSDEFNGNSLNATNWNYQNGGGGWGNKELEYYRPNNVIVENGHLTIQAKMEDYAGYKYTSGRIATKRSWTYGRLEVRAQLPKGDFLWPAIWMMPTKNIYGQWALSGEIDIMEYRAQDEDLVQSTLHFGGLSAKSKSSGSGMKSRGVDLSKDYHTYACEWTKDAIVFLIDDQVFHTESLDRSFGTYTHAGAPFDQDFHLILNVAVGGQFFNQAKYGTLSTAKAAQWSNPTMKIDYVRLYNQVTPSPNKPSTSKTSAKTSATSKTSAKTTATSKTSAKTSAAVPKTSAAVPKTSAAQSNKCNGVTFDVKAYSCVVDAYTKKSVLCPINNGACNKACYSTAKYTCNNGALKPK